MTFYDIVAGTAVTAANKMSRDHRLVAVITRYKPHPEEGEDLDEPSGDNDSEDIESLTDGLLQMPKLEDLNLWSVCTLVGPLYHSVAQCR